MAFFRNRNTTSPFTGTLTNGVTPRPGPDANTLSGSSLFGGSSSQPGPLQRLRIKRLEAGKPLVFGNIGENKTLQDFETAFPDSTSLGPSSPGSIANDIKEQEAARQAAILEGRTNIENAFARFDPAYYNQFVSDYTGYYNPQIDEQYGRAVGTSRAKLADRGVGQSSIAGHTFADLARQAISQRSQVADQALSAANNLRANVERTRSDLYSLNETAADPAAANVRATAEATALAAPPTVSPLGQVFAATLQPLIYGAQAYQNRAPTPYQSPYSLPSGSGSGRVVR